jgi:hypothetical protein
MAKKAKDGKKTYRALNGINWPDGKGGEHRAERGDLITSAKMPDEIATGLMEALPGRPADLESLDEDASTSDVEGKE